MNTLSINKTTQNDHHNGILPRGNNTRYTGQGTVWQIVCGDQVFTGFRKKCEALAHLTIFNQMTEAEKIRAIETDFVAVVYMVALNFVKQDPMYQMLFSVIADAKEI